MSVLCPHFLPDYFRKVHDVLVAFQPQISEILFSKISNRLVARGVITEEDYYQIFQLDSNVLQMEHLLIQIMSKRIRAFEYFVLVLMEENCQPWLAEELYNSYLRHVAAHIKQLKDSKKCECPQTEPLSNAVAIVKDKLSYVAGKIDNCLFNIGTSIGFMDQTLYPTKNLLEPINKNLPFLKQNWKFDHPDIDQPPSPHRLFLTTAMSSNQGNLVKLESRNSEPIPLQITGNNEIEIAISDENEDLYGSLRTNASSCPTSILPPVIHKNEFDVAFELETVTPTSDIPTYNTGLSDLEWDNYDLLVENNLIQIHSNKSRISGCSQSAEFNDSCDVRNDPHFSHNKLPGPNSTPLRKSPSILRKNGVQVQKNISTTRAAQQIRGRTKEATNKKPPLTPPPFNTTSQPRLSPTDYASIQKSIEWCNKRQN